MPRTSATEIACGYDPGENVPAMQLGEKGRCADELARDATDVARGLDTFERESPREEARFVRALRSCLPELARRTGAEQAPKLERDSDDRGVPHFQLGAVSGAIWFNDRDRQPPGPADDLR
jgi:hypothetical protein